jgi:type I restriction enzyme S subunit
MKAAGKTPKDDKWKQKYNEPETVNSENLPLLPDGWCWVNADQVCFQITDGEHNQPPYQADGFPMLTAKHVQDGFVQMTDVKFINEKAFAKARFRCSPMNGDLLIVSVGATTGRAAIVSDCPPFAIVRSVLLLKPLIEATFILNWIRTLWCQAWIQKASGASAQAHLYINDTKKLPIPFPGIYEQKEIVNRIEKLFKIADNIEQQYQQTETDLETLNQSILAKAFRGELVPQNPNDEPASVLLERIRKERETDSKPAKQTRQKPPKTDNYNSTQLTLEGIE